MYRTVGLVIALALVLVTSNSVRAEEGQISKGQLSELGLDGMEMVSDTQGQKIRGKFLYNPAFIAQTFTQIAGPNPTPQSLATATYVQNVMLAQNTYFASLLPGTVFASPTQHVVNPTTPTTPTGL